MEEGAEDLRLAVRLGLLVRAVRGLPAGVELDRGLIRYDPALDPGERALRVCAAIRPTLPERPHSPR